MNIRELLVASGMTQQSFSKYFKIPKRTIENWSNGDRKPPEWGVELMEYKLRKENMLMFKETYHDRNGDVIEAGTKLRHVETGKIEEIFMCSGEDGKGVDLGILASNPEYLKRHPDAEEEYYPLYQFDLNEYEIIKDGETN